MLNPPAGRPNHFLVGTGGQFIGRTCRRRRWRASRAAPARPLLGMRERRRVADRESRHIHRLEPHKRAAPKAFMTRVPRSNATQALTLE